LSFVKLKLSKVAIFKMFLNSLLKIALLQEGHLAFATSQIFGMICLLKRKKGLWFWYMLMWNFWLC